MKPGTYICKLADAGVVFNSNGDMVPFLKFENENNEFITWRGSVKTEKAKEFAVKTLCKAGFVGNDWDDVAIGMPRFIPIPLEIVVIESKTDAGKIYSKVQWINASREQKRVTSSEVKQKMSDKAAFAKHKTEKPSAASEAGF